MAGDPVVAVAGQSHALTAWQPVFGAIVGLLYGAWVEVDDPPKRREKDAGGQLRYIAGSIAIHILDRDFIQRMAAGGEGANGSTAAAQALPFHRADKKIPTVDAQGNAVKP